jgi:hypothetical protein
MNDEGARRLSRAICGLTEALRTVALTLPEAAVLHTAAKELGVFCLIDVQIPFSLFDLAQTPEVETLAAPPVDDAKFLKSLRIVPDITPEKP